MSSTPNFDATLDRADPNYRPLELSSPAQAGAAAARSGPLSIDELSKWIALVLVFVYVTGYLITSVNDFRFGFTQTNPLRPRIIAAGGWFAMFLAVPCAIVLEWKRHSIWKRDVSKWHKAALLLYTYYLIANGITLPLGLLFNFDSTATARFTILLCVEIVLIVGAGIVIMVGQDSRKIPRWLLILTIFALYGSTSILPFRDLFVRGQFLSNAPSLWVLLVGMTLLLEMKRRDWNAVVGDWPPTLVFFFFLMALFATKYYPHIQSQWGGGAPLPIAITLSKDAPVHSGQTVLCSLIDETDSGFYVVGTDEKHATFIPRNEISLVRFADGNEQSIFSATSK